MQMSDSGTETRRRLQAYRNLVSQNKSAWSATIHLSLGADLSYRVKEEMEMSDQDTQARFSSLGAVSHPFVAANVGV